MFRKIIFCLFLSTLCQSQLFAQAPRDFEKEIKNLKTIRDSVALKQKIDSLKAGSEEDLNVVMMYAYEQGMDYQPLIELSASRFPRGRFAFDKAMQKFSKEKDLKKKEHSLDSLKKLFPNQDYDQAYILLSGDYARAGKIDKAMGYLNKTKGSSRQTAWSQMALNSDTNTLKLLIPRINQAINLKNTPKEEQITLLKMKRYILDKLKNYKEAAAVAKNIINMDAKPSEYDLDNYNVLLSKSGEYRLALPGLEQAIYREIDNDELRDEYKKAYQFVYPGRDASAHLDSIQKSIIKKYEAKYTTKNVELIKEKAPDFELLDVNGKKVSLADFKGKILVIDFWATWCGPCKASLPGMQMLVNKYKEDPNIAFLFVHTSEPPGKSFEEVKNSSLDYFKSHQFSLPLFIDLKNKETRENKVSKSFKVSGIPHKVIVDQNGFIRSNTIGFNGSNIDLVAEMSSLIEAVKKSEQ